jgi:hypothetical protein
MLLDRRLRILSLVAMCVTARGAQGQRGPFSVVPLPPTRFGLTAGVDLAKLAGPNFTDATYRNGFVGGISLVTPFSPNVAFQLDALYAMKGARRSPVPGADVTLFVDYIDVPVMLRGDFALSPRVRPFAYTGPSFNLRVRCGVDESSSSGSVTTSCDDLETAGPNGKFNSYDVGWVLGGGMAFDVGSRALDVAVRYERGFRNILSSGDLKNRTFSFLMSLELPLPRR